MKKERIEKTFDAGIRVIAKVIAIITTVVIMTAEAIGKIIWKNGRD